MIKINDNDEKRTNEMNHLFSGRTGSDLINEWKKVYIFHYIISLFLPFLSLFLSLYFYLHQTPMTNLINTKIINTKYIYTCIYNRSQ